MGVVVEGIGGRHQSAEVEAADHVDRRVEVGTGVGVAAADGGLAVPQRGEFERHVRRHADHLHLAARRHDLEIRVQPDRESRQRRRQLHHQPARAFREVGQEAQELDHVAQALFGDPDILLLDEPTNNLDINTIRWLEEVINARNSTMIIISHDRHFLNQVCTHMADLDYGTLKVYPGNYDDYMEASTLAKQQLQKDNAKAKDRIADLEEFVRRFRAHKAKARQATSRMKQIEKLKVEDVKPSSRQYPFIRFLVDPKEKLVGVMMVQRYPGSPAAAVPCGACPGAAGVSPLEHIPSLAGPPASRRPRCRPW